jgi:hypothetical protein
MIPIRVAHPASATAVREKQELDYLDPRVAAYVQKRGLYQAISE